MCLGCRPPSESVYTTVRARHAVSVPAPSCLHLSPIRCSRAPRLIISHCDCLGHVSTPSRPSLDTSKTREFDSDTYTCRHNIAVSFHAAEQCYGATPTYKAVCLHRPAMLRASLQALSTYWLHCCCFVVFVNITLQHLINYNITTLR